MSVVAWIPILTSYDFPITCGSDSRHSSHWWKRCTEGEVGDWLIWWVNSWIPDIVQGLGGKLTRFMIATVYWAKDIITKQTIAVKLELEPTTCRPAPHQTHLEYKYQVLCKLEGGTRLSWPLWFGREAPYCAMVMDNLSPSLDNLLRVSPDGGLQLHHIATLGLQMVHFVDHFTF